MDSDCFVDDKIGTIKFDLNEIKNGDDIVKTLKFPKACLFRFKTIFHPLLFRLVTKNKKFNIELIVGVTFSVNLQQYGTN